MQTVTNSPFRDAQGASLANLRVERIRRRSVFSWSVGVLNPWIFVTKRKEIHSAKDLSSFIMSRLFTGILNQQRLPKIKSHLK